MEFLRELMKLKRNINFFHKRFIVF